MKKLVLTAMLMLLPAAGFADEMDDKFKENFIENFILAVRGYKDAQILVAFQYKEGLGAAANPVAAYAFASLAAVNYQSEALSGLAKGIKTELEKVLTADEIKTAENFKSDILTKDIDSLVIPKKNVKKDVAAEMTRQISPDKTDKSKDPGKKPKDKKP